MKAFIILTMSIGLVFISVFIIWLISDLFNIEISGIMKSIGVVSLGTLCFIISDVSVDKIKSKKEQ